MSVKIKFFTNMKKKYKKLDPLKKKLFLMGIVIGALIILAIVVSSIIKKIKGPSVNEMFNRFINQNNNINSYESNIIVATNKNEFELNNKIQRDKDTSHIVINDSAEIYVDTLDRKYQIYVNTGNKWEGYVASKYTFIDDERTEYIEKDGLTTYAVISKDDIHNSKVVKNNDKTYDLSFEMKYDKLDGLLGQPAFALKYIPEYKEYEAYFNLYKEDIKILVTVHFDKNKNLVGWKAESNEEYAKKANESYNGFNLTEFKLKINNISTEKLDVYVPVKIDVEAFKTKQ